MNPAQTPPPPAPPARRALAVLAAPLSATLPAPLPRAAETAASGGVPRALAGLLVGLGGVLLAAASAYGATLLFGPGLPWVAPLAAALGVVAAALPIALLMVKLGRGIEPAAAAASAAPGPGVAQPLFMDLAEREWARARRYGCGAALLLVDVDRYARLCEVHGQTAADAVLVALLRQTAPALRPADLLTRLNETQLAVFLAHADATGALDVAERIRERAEHLEVPFDAAVPAQHLRVTVSVGVAHLRPAHLHLRALLEDAEDAVVAARQAGGNCVRAAPVGAGPSSQGAWRGDDRRSRPTKPKQGGST